MTVRSIPVKEQTVTHLWEFRAEDFVFARLDDAVAGATALPDGAGRVAALHRIECLRLLAAEHCIYVDSDGKNYCRCFTCTVAHGVPCSTMRLLAGMWRDHPDYVAAWNESRWARDVASAGGFRKMRWPETGSEGRHDGAENG